MLAIQFIALSELRPQPCSAHWNTLPPLAGVNYSRYSSVAVHTALLAEASGGTVCYRIADADSRREPTPEEQAYLLLERVATADISDEELEELTVLAANLDRAGVPYRGWR